MTDASIKVSDMAKKAKAEQPEEEKDSGEKKRILLVDDDPEIVDALRFALEAKGYTVVTREAKDSAGWGSWRVRAAEVLELMFPL